MNPEEIAAKEIADKIKDQALKVDSLGQEVESLKKAGEKTEAIEKALETAKSTLKTLEDFQTKATQDLVDLRKELDAEKRNKSTHKGLSFAQELEKALTENADKLKAFKGENKNTEWIRMEVSKVGNMVLGNYTGGTALTDSLDPGITPIATRRPFILQLANTQATSSNTIRYVEKKNRDGGAAGTAEGAAKSQADFELVEASVSVIKKTAYIKVSKEMMDDIPFIMGEINSELRTLVELEVDGDLYNGDGTGTNLKGVTAFATAFSAGSFAGTVVNPGIADVLRVSIALIAANLFEANAILMHPNDVAKMELKKDNEGQYVLPPFTSVNGMVVKGIRVVENTGVTEGDFVVGDFTKMNIKQREAFGIAVGLDQDDFTKNFVTILGEWRGVSYFKSNHTGAFIKGTFATAIAALDSAV
jgi:HK97 family phage major capsid protein